jgi:hypothetical protein
VGISDAGYQMSANNFLVLNMQAVPAAVPDVIRDPAKSTARFIENVILPAPLTTRFDNATQEFRDVETVALVVKEAKADFELQPIILDEVRDDEVLVEMKYSGICRLLGWQLIG